MGERDKDALRVYFDQKLKLEFHGTKVTSDNGGDNPKSTLEKGHNPTAPWRGCKGQPYEGGHHVPFIARWPQKIPAGVVSCQMISLVDLTATCCAIAGVKMPADVALDSFNILPALLGQPRSQPVRSLMVVGTRGLEYLVLRQGDWKLIMDVEKQRFVLYNLSDDPQEKQNLASKQPEKLEQMTCQLMAYVERGCSRPSATAKPTTLKAILQQKDCRNRILQQKFPNLLPKI